ncbi:MAG: class I SAM-dependent methyltransferase [Bacteroidota bacterium]
MTSNQEKNIINSWFQNAKPWISAVQNEEIESRKLITNQAIIDVIAEKAPKNVLDVGCGEGWLCREINAMGIQAHGIDLVPELIAEAQSKGGGTFQVLTYNELAQGVLKEKYELVVCNFSLLGEESVEQAFQGMKHILANNGHFIIQTIHPIAGCGDEKYEDGWRKGSWKGFSNDFTNPAPWYFRTQENWQALFQKHEIPLIEMIEPIHPQSGNHASLILIGKLTK